MTRVIRYTVIVVVTLTILFLMWQVSMAIVLFLLSLAVAAALRPLINSILSRQVSKPLALGLVYFLLVAYILGTIFLAGPSLLNEIQQAGNDFVYNYDQAKTNWPSSGTVFQKALAEQLPPSADLFQTLTSEEGIPALRSVFTLAQNFFSNLGQLAIVIVLSLYWSSDQLRFERLGLSLLPTEYHPKALHAWRSIESGVGAYIRSETAQSILAGLLLWMIYSMIGLRYPTLLGLWGALARLVPWFGALLAVLPALFVTIGNSTLGVVAIVSTIAVLFLLKEVIEPRVFQRHKYSSLLIVLFVIGLAESFGFAGVILAPPLAVAVQILFRQLYPFPATQFSQEVSDKVADIRTRLLLWRRRTQKLTNRKNRLLINRVYSLIKRTADYLQEY
ncbi:MAG: AI-2E family transporter [Anaerolineales bacterium]